MLSVTKRFNSVLLPSLCWAFLWRSSRGDMNETEYLTLWIIKQAFSFFNPWISCKAVINWRREYFFTLYCPSQNDCHSTFVRRTGDSQSNHGFYLINTKTLLNGGTCVENKNRRFTGSEILIHSTLTRLQKQAVSHNKNVGKHSK